MRRKPGTLVPFEDSILSVATRLREEGFAEVHGFQIAKEMGNEKVARNGSLYRALRRLEDQGFLTSRWEESQEGSRPRRRLYQLTEKAT